MTKKEDLDDLNELIDELSQVMTILLGSADLRDFALLEKTTGRGYRVTHRMKDCVRRIRGDRSPLSVFLPEKEVPPMMEQLGKILIVDDDETTRKVLVFQLISQGFSVESFAGAEDLREYLRVRNGKTTGVILMDLVLEGTDGKTLADEVKTAHPHVHILFMTAADTAPIQGHRIFKKPFKDYVELGNVLWGLLKVSSWKCEFDEVKTLISAQGEKSKACRKEVDDKLEAITAPGLAGKELSKLPDWARRLVRVLLLIVIFLGGLVLYDFHGKLDKVTELQIKVGGEIDPAIKDIKREQTVMAADLKKVLVVLSSSPPASPTTQPPGIIPRHRVP